MAFDNFTVISNDLPQGLVINKNIITGTIEDNTKISTLTIDIPGYLYTKRKLKWVSLPSPDIITLSTVQLFYSVVDNVKLDMQDLAIDLQLNDHKFNDKTGLTFETENWPERNNN